MVTKTMMALFCTTLFANAAWAQTDFFWSFRDLNQGATNTDAVETFGPGESGSLFMYYTTNGPADSELSVGAFLDVATSQSGVIQFTAAETFDFEIQVAGTTIDWRWQMDGMMGAGGSAGETGTVTDDVIDAWHAFTVTGGQGILETNNGSGDSLDLGYDAGSDAFLFGRVDFTVIGTGSVDILAELDEDNFCPGVEVCEYTFGNANIIVVPEPALIGMVFLAPLTFSTRIRRRSRGRA